MARLEGKKCVLCSTSQYCLAVLAHKVAHLRYAFTLGALVDGGVRNACRQSRNVSGSRQARIKRCCLNELITVLIRMFGLTSVTYVFVVLDPFELSGANLIDLIAAAAASSLFSRHCLPNSA